MGSGESFPCTNDDTLDNKKKIHSKSTWGSFHFHPFLSFFFSNANFFPPIRRRRRGEERKKKERV